MCCFSWPITCSISTVGMIFLLSSTTDLLTSAFFVKTGFRCRSTIDVTPKNDGATDIAVQGKKIEHLLSSAVGLVEGFLKSGGNYTNTQ